MASHASDLPRDLRIYALEGVTATQDDAIVKQGLTIAGHDEKLTAHAVSIATLDTRVSAHDRAIADLTALTNKVIWALTVFSLTIAGSAAGVILTGSGG